MALCFSRGRNSEMLDKPKIVILEGISGCGKSTLHHRVTQLVDYRDLLIERFTPSCWVYNKLYGRPVYDYESINEDLMVHHDVHVVWLICKPEIAYRRCIQKNDDLIEDLKKANFLFEQYFTDTNLGPIHVVRTDDRSVDETVKVIGERVYGFHYN
jgi:thymidylate kinase